MRKGRALICGFGLVAGLGAEPAWAGLIVKTHKPQVTLNYWIARNEDLRRQRATDPHAPLRTILERFGRRPINSLPIRTKAHVLYTVFPECNGGAREPGILADGGQAEVWVDC
jgi:hypothetical protein